MIPKNIVIKYSHNDSIFIFLIIFYMTRRYGSSTPACREAYAETLEQFDVDNTNTFTPWEEKVNREIAIRFDVSVELKKAIAERTAA